MSDLDGTLVDGEPNHYEVGRQTLAEQGVMDFRSTRGCAAAGLLLRGGQGEFTARGAYEWLVGSPV
ncbi:hypothetical protein ACIOKD_21820 [Streptomyces sp. NPDC087844]|uniref:hypothetical protein n=1 Tax=Streptomyces sp. NPDC087844 TaxID=3365805 RepID=UPI0037FC1FA0